ncbi:hypothetical protein [Prochlorococcus sp. MIT 1300]|uniref:hypothetical protein n=1 Tax=Prochlorococcus sp. MIT 1300 TaxID=3096218 RepID=UPI002A756BBA|nr:hypothetical protein [Prochlorococcus sp. MIT 1300]
METKNKKTPSFEQAMNAAMLWCKSWEKGELSDEVLADRVSELIETRDGARGFFVITLATDLTVIDRLPEPLILQLRIAGEMIVDLAVKNLAMSTAMSIHHERVGDIKQKANSQRITNRCIELLRSLEPRIVKKRLEILLDATSGNGEDVNFLKRWNYDKGQILAISKSILSVAEKKQY